ncbi:MAG: ABC transporter substrate binding protein [Candidatus Cloacimonadota bacterium]|nr:ABC transporter substrate binding protein [Candidatus Cloacimonadota bacterium]
MNVYFTRLKKRLLIFSIIFSVLFLSGNLFASTPKIARNILIIHSYHPGYPWVENINSGIQSALSKSDLDINTQVEYLDTKRNDPADLFPTLRQLFLKKYHANKPDVIIVSDNNAFDFLLKYRMEIFPGVPIVFCGINNYSDSLITGQLKITGVAEACDLKGTLKLIIDLHSNLSQIVGISDVTPTGRINSELFRKAVSELNLPNIKFIEFAELTESQLRDSLENLPANSAILELSFFQDPTGATFTIQESIKILSSYGLPVYSLWDMQLGLGIVGGILTSGFQQGKTAADLALRILNGEDAEKIPVVAESPNVPMFDYDQLTKFRIPESRLPKASTIINKPVTFYSSYKILIWSVLTIIFILIGFIIALIYNNFRRKKAENLLKRKTEIQKKLFHVAKNLNRETELNDILQLIAETALEVMDGYGCGIYSLDRHQNILKPIVVIDPDYRDEILATELDLENSFTGKSVTAAKILIFNKPLTVQLGTQIPDTPESANEKVIALPFISEHEVLGAMCINRFDKDFSQEDITLAETFATFATSAFKNTLNFQDLITEMKRRGELTDKLKTSENLLSAVIKNSPIGISIRDKKGLLLHSNKAWERIWGSPETSSGKEKSKSKSISDKEFVYPKQDQNKINKIYASGGRLFIPEIEIKKMSFDKPKIISQYLYALTNDKGAVKQVVILTEDITQQKKAEITQKVLYNIVNAISQTNDLKNLFALIHKNLKKIITADNFYVALYDNKTNIINIPYYKDKVKTETPEPKELGTGLTAFVIRTRKSLLLTETDRNQMIAQGKLLNANWKSKVWMGSPLKSDEKIIGVIAVQSYENKNAYTQNDLKILEIVANTVADVVQRLKAEQQLKESEEKFRDLFENASDMIWTSDKTGNFISVNNQFEKLIGFSKEELVGFQSLKLIDQADRANSMNKYNEVKKGKTVGYETLVKSKDGEQHIFSNKLRPIFENKKVVGIQGIARDITEQKEIQKKIEKALREKEVMMQEIFHRVKNNMQVVSSLLSLQANSIDNEEARKALSESQDRIRSMAMIHEKLYRSTDLANIDFSDYINQLVKTIYSSHYHDLENELELEINVENVYLDIILGIPCGLIINEIVSNAFKHAFAGVKFPKLTVTMTQKNTEIELAISDNGVGIGENFDLENPSTLGMELITGLTDQIEGTMKVSKANGGGTTFTICFKNSKDASK